MVIVGASPCRVYAVGPYIFGGSHSISVRLLSLCALATSGDEEYQALSAPASTLLQSDRLARVSMTGLSRSVLAWISCINGSSELPATTIRKKSSGRTGVHMGMSMSKVSSERMGVDMVGCEHMVLCRTKQKSSSPCLRSRMLSS